MRVLCSVGARPNFVKVAPLLESAKAFPRLRMFLTHTGQHAVDSMSGLLFRDLGIRTPDRRLEVTDGRSSGGLVDRIRRAFVQVVRELGPDVVLVVGDVHSTLATTLAAREEGVPVAHVEAGLRSFDKSMPEERNRIAVDHASRWLFTTEREAGTNLGREGIHADRVHFVGNVMIDTLEKHRATAAALRHWEHLGLTSGSYAVLTLHRPATVDEPRAFAAAIDALAALQDLIPVVFPIHPRTCRRIVDHGLVGRLRALRRVLVQPPLGYLEFLSLMTGARVVLTDSGGIQEETTALDVPCLTLRDNTERPVTLTVGTNRLVGREPAAIVAAAREVLRAPPRRRAMPELWDGRAAGRILKILAGHA
jgi:UDP-N-acetylglucosamine 2-epimerase (non-hydrolysing)